MAESADTRDRFFLTERTLLTVSVVLGGFQAWYGRNAMGPDGVSYLDIGDAYLRGDWKAAINGYWSPMYSVVLGTAMRVFKPSLRWEFPVVHLVNFVVFLAALFCFRILLRSAVAWLKANSTGDLVALPEEVVLGIGYMLFLWSALVLDDLVLVTPDLLVEALVFLLGALLLDLRVHHSPGKFVAFGAVCGFAYLTKGVMFPLAFLFLAVLLFSAKITKARLGAVLLAGVAFLIVSSPFIFALSKAKSGFTYGDTGKIAYEEMVSTHSPTTHWQGEPDGSGVPIHPTRKILDDPGVFEYAGPVGGTYPPWYDPSYWNDGMRWQFHLRPQILVLVQSALNYGKMLPGYSAFIAGMVIFLLLGGRSALKSVAQSWPLFVVACAAAGIYALVLVLSRYLGGFAALFSVGILVGIRLPRDNRFEPFSRFVGLGVMFAMFLCLSSVLVEGAYQGWAVGHGVSMKEQLDAAVGLQRLGFRASDRIAVVGDGVTNYWARLGRFKIISEVAAPDALAREFWARPAADKARAYESVRSTGAKAIIAWSPPASELLQGWKQIRGTQYYVYVFPT